MINGDGHVDGNSLPAAPSPSQLAWSEGWGENIITNCFLFPMWARENPPYPFTSPPTLSFSIHYSSLFPLPYSRNNLNEPLDPCPCLDSC